MAMYLLAQDIGFCILLASSSYKALVFFFVCLFVLFFKQQSGVQKVEQARVLEECVITLK